VNGLQAYRFPYPGARDPQGVAHQSRRSGFLRPPVDELLRADIRPFITLYHWDLPQALQDKGGWDDPDSVRWFADYADLMSRQLGDRVKDWITHNEPWVVAFVGNWFGAHAPGLTDMATALRVGHNVLLSHGAAVPVIRQNSRGARVGITLNLTSAMPASSSHEDAQAAWLSDGFSNRWFLDPVFKGSYPDDMVKILGDNLKGINLETVKAAAVPIDFLGVNYYTHDCSSDEHNCSGPVKNEGAEHTEMDWEVYPQGLTDVLVRVHKDYAPAAMYVTENGAAYQDPEPSNGVVSDPRRVAYLEGHFQAASAAIAQGVPLKGYFVWSLMDNFEWAEGYTKRFGIVYVDYKKQKRTPKTSPFLPADHYHKNA
jgi:beta-glucosidase